LCTGNGYITTTVLREILKELDDKLTAQDLDLMIEEIDSDGSGTVDFDGKIHEEKFVFLYPFESYTIEINWWDTLFSH
jgi:Ca2+-binding EF-hand superfamily protein